MIKISKASFKTESLAGLTTFFTMAYVVVVVPSTYAQAGINFTSSYIAVCLITILATLALGLFANLPIAMAPALGLMSYTCYEVVGNLHFTWDQALAAVFISGVIFVLITITRLREMILTAIPHSLGLAITAGIGFFIGFIALKNVGVIVPDSATIVTLGKLAQWSVMLFFIGFLLIAILDSYKIPGAILIGIVVVTLLGDGFGLNHFAGVLALPHFSFYDPRHFDFHPLFTAQGIPVLFTFVMIALFDSTGTLLGLVKLIPFNESEGYFRINRALLVESTGTCGAALLGTTTLSPFIESAAGIGAGGRTGWTAIIIASCFLLLLFCEPLAAAIPPFATASALFYVACIMFKPFVAANWEDMSELVPAVMTLFIIPLSFSIADGIGLGIICYVAFKAFYQRWQEIHPMLWGLALLFLVYFVV